MIRCRILVVGNSHTQMVAKAHAAWAENNTSFDIDIRWLQTQRHGDTPIPEALEEIATLGPDDLLVLSRLGALHNVLGLFEHHRPYVILGAGQPDREVVDRREVLPAAALRSTLETMIAEDSLVQELHAAAACRTIHYFSPPPKRQLRKEGKTRTLDTGERVYMKFSDPWTRLAFWQIENDVATAHLRNLGIEICPVPPKAIDPEGFLAEQFCATDATHANQRYGMELLKYFETLCPDT